MNCGKYQEAHAKLAKHPAAGHLTTPAWTTKPRKMLPKDSAYRGETPASARLSHFGLLPENFKQLRDHLHLPFLFTRELNRGERRIRGPEGDL